MRTKTNFLILLSLVFLAACTKRTAAPAEETAEDVVRRFVEISASAADLGDKKKLQALCSGPMYEAFGSMPDDVFRLSYLGAKIKLIEFKVINTTTQGNSTVVHYRVVVQNDQGTDPTREASEREVEVLKSNDSKPILTIRAVRARGSDEIAFTRGMIF